MDQILPGTPYLKEPPPADDMTREAMYIKGNLMPRMIGRTPTYEDPELAAKQKLESIDSEKSIDSENSIDNEKQTKNIKDGNKLGTQEGEANQGEKRNPDKT